MVAKCVNPYCNRPCHTLERGKLFVIEYPPTLASGLKDRVREQFWLCEECAKSMTVAIRREHRKVAIRIINLSPNGRRKLDFVPEQEPVVRQPLAFREKFYPEFSVEAS